MSFSVEQFRACLDGALRRLEGEAVPMFYVHCGADYGMVGLFDDLPREYSISGLSGEEGGLNLDGEEPRLLLGSVQGVPVMVSVGVRRVAEGRGHLPALFPTALAARWGVRNHLFLDSAASLSPEFKAGKWGILADFASHFAFSPLEGLQGLLAHPWPDLSEALDQVQNSELVNALAEFGEPPRFCVVHGVPGFQLPTEAEAQRIRADGGDFLCHDLVLHVALSHALGCRVSSLVLAGVQLLPGRRTRFTREDLLETGKFCAKALRQGLRKAIREMADAADGYGENVLPEADADELLRESIRRSATRSSPLKAFLKRSE